MQRLKNILIILLILVVAVFVGKNVIVKAAVVGGVKAITGLDTSIGSISVGLLHTNVGIKNLRIGQPSGFPSGAMVDIPEVYVDYELSAFLKGTVHLEEMRLHLHELQVVKNAEGKVNLNSVAALQPSKQQDVKQSTAPTSGKAPQFQIDQLELRVDRVVYTDYTTTPPSTKEFSLSINQHFSGITNPYLLGSLVVSQALMQTTVAQLANFDVRGLQSTVQTGLKQGAAQLSQTLTSGLSDVQGLSKHAFGTASKTVGTATGAAKDAVGATTDAVKKLFGN